MNWRLKLAILMSAVVVWLALAGWPTGSLLTPALAEIQQAPWGFRTFLFKPALVLGTTLLPLAWFASVGYASWRFFNWLFNVKGPQ